MSKKYRYTILGKNNRSTTVDADESSIANLCEIIGRDRIVDVYRGGEVTGDRAAVVAPERVRWGAMHEAARLNPQFDLRSGRVHDIAQKLVSAINRLRLSHLSSAERFEAAERAVALVEDIEDELIYNA